MMADMSASRKGVTQGKQEIAEVGELCSAIYGFACESGHMTSRNAKLGPYERDHTFTRNCRGPPAHADTLNTKLMLLLHTLLMPHGLIP